MLFTFISLFLSFLFLASASPIISEECRHGKKLNEYVSEVNALLSDGWPSSKVKTLAMHFISIERTLSGGEKEAVVSQEEAFLMGAGLNSLFAPSGIQFDFSYELLEEESLPSEYRASNFDKTKSKGLTGWAQNNLKHLKYLPSFKVFFLASSENRGGWGRMVSRRINNFDGTQVLYVTRGMALYSLATLVHETGHNLGVEHVFVNNCGSDREQTSTWTGGDGLLDTAAMPNGMRGCDLSDFPLDFKECKGDSLPVVDLYTSFTEYDAGNWMNYGRCRYEHGHFTLHQTALMRCVADEIFYPALLPDESSPDSLLSATPSSRDWLEPMASLYDVGGHLPLAFGADLGDKELIRRNKKSRKEVRVALLPLAAAIGLRQETAESTLARQQWIDPFLIFEGKLRGDSSSVARVPLAYKTSSSRAQLTKGRYVVAIESDDDVYFSPPFSLGYRTCFSNEAGAHGVCRPAAECAGLTASTVDSSNSQCSDNDIWSVTDMVCCVIVNRPVMELGDLFQDLHEFESDPIDVPVWKSQAQPKTDFKLELSGSLFIGGPMVVTFDTSALRPPLVLDYKADDTFRNLLSESPVYESGTQVTFYRSAEGLRDFCEEYQVNHVCYGTEEGEPLPSPRLRRLELINYGANEEDDDEERIYADLVFLARTQASLLISEKESNRETLASSSSGSISIHLPDDLREQLYYVRLVAAVGDNEEEQISAPFEVNLAPCSSAARGTCRHELGCNDLGKTPAAGDTGCEGFVSTMRCCEDDITSVFGAYRGSVLQTAEDAGPGINSTVLVLASVGGALFLIMIVGVIVAACLLSQRGKRRTDSSASERYSERYGGASMRRRRSGTGSSHRRRSSTRRYSNAGDISMRRYSKDISAMMKPNRVGVIRDSSRRSDGAPPASPAFY